MNNIFQENKKSFFLLLSLLFILLIVVFFLFYQPITEELKTRENTQKILETDIQLLQVKIEEADNETTEFGYENLLMEKKLPLNQELEQLILTLQEMELLSGNKVENISFTYGNSAPQREMEETEEEIDLELGTGTEGEEAVVPEREEIIVIDGMPENLQVITVTFNITSPNYEQYQEFIELIEEQERFMTVTNMSFQLPAERELIVDEDNETITANISITTFYYNE